MVDFYGSSIVVLSARVSFGCALLFTNFESSTIRRVYIGRTKPDTKVTDDTGPANTLKVLEPQIYPASIPGENILFM